MGPSVKTEIIIVTVHVKKIIMAVYLSVLYRNLKKVVNVGSQLGFGHRTIEIPI